MQIFNDRPHDRKQSKPQQIEENLNHTKHFLWPKGTETGEERERKKPKTLKIMEAE